MSRNKVTEIFAGINSVDGYINLLENELREADTVYILKGSPGSGKSTMLKRLLAYAKTKDEEATVVRCSSDPDSLDAVIFNNRKIAIADGTAPHVLEPKMVGVRERIVNLGDCWDYSKIVENSNEIIKLSAEKSKSYNDAYRMIKAYGEIEKARDSLIDNAVDYKKIKTVAARFFSTNIKPDGDGLVKIMQTDVFCYKGFDRSDSFMDSHTTVLFRDKFNIGSVFLYELFNIAKSKKADVYITISPIDSNKITALYFPESRLYIKSNKFVPFDGSKTVSADRFIIKQQLKQYKEKLAFYKKLEKSLLSEAVELFTKAREEHMKLEKIYAEAINFKKIDDKTRMLKNEIFSS